MGSATVKTAAATQAILDQTIKSVAVNLDGTLTFTKWNDDEETTVGNLKGPKGDTGDVSPGTSGFTTLTQLLDSVGYGVLAHDKVTTLQNWGLQDDVWKKVSGLSVTFDKVINRHYEINLSMQMSTEDPNGATFDVEIRHPDDTMVARLGAASPSTNRTVQVGGSVIFKAGETQSDQVYEVWARGNTAYNIEIRSDYSPTRLTIVDIGMT
jgi:hypothetical protein